MAKAAKVCMGQVKKAWPFPFRRKKVLGAQSQYPEPWHLLSHV